MGHSMLTAQVQCVIDARPGHLYASVSMFFDVSLLSAATPINTSCNYPTQGQEVIYVLSQVVHIN
jgi:hypothetical protein